MKKSNPPKLVLRFFRWYCHPKLVDHIEGDLIEVYQQRFQKKGRKKADIRFIIDVILLFRPSIIKPIEGYQNLNNYGMFKSYFKIGWRNLLRNKGYSFINIGGLALGMAVAMLNGLWIWDEFSYDKYFNNYEHIAQVAEKGINLEEGGSWLGTVMTYPLSTTLIEEYRQDFKRIARVSWLVDGSLSAGEEKMSARGFYAEEDAPESFAFKMIRGTRAGLKTMPSILISESVAQSLFGSDDPINRTLRMNNSADVTIT